ncbi:hypothetical protein GUITHDRAFT_134974 [Guillardia theta CCMP2712]|uniref:Protein kinase domain-containing protein n=1 Tax=Guillardia theta (strain CCMP2712) TaxID=905079 RepID=L1JRH2_GUITC|nr:hypothetical protein GUITHDRAFT_134974 [Guillardia theta CCMP2712]EKX50879.1 hypothetical protein GUITHDRAFT_134974 [Guillardia theta CCMP2712]|eukprot:XP_005837859.1 hypothetical protein GUITHDRAFT_134974 [Guillardia theta CCMP2712]
MPISWEQAQAESYLQGAHGFPNPGISHHPMSMMMPSPHLHAGMAHGMHMVPISVQQTMIPPIPYDENLVNSMGGSAREVANSWAIRDGFNQQQLFEFDKLMNLVVSTYIEKDRVESSRAIDQGSFAKVYSATYDGCPVAVKIIATPGQTHNIKAKMRELLLELSILVRVRHPNVVTFWGTTAHFPRGHGEAEPFISLVFELCEKGSLEKVLFESPQKLSVEKKMDIALQVAYGLSYLHTSRAHDKRSIIHRDINTRNILITNDWTAKICDFGCARVVYEGNRLTTTTISGSPAYMAPEQLLGEDLTEAVDVWAYATVLWEMMNERKPWGGPLHGDMEGLKEPAERPTMNQVINLLQTAFDQLQSGIGKVEDSIAFSY